MTTTEAFHQALAAATGPTRAIPAQQKLTNHLPISTSHINNGVTVGVD